MMKKTILVILLASAPLLVADSLSNAQRLLNQQNANKMCEKIALTQCFSRSNTGCEKIGFDNYKRVCRNMTKEYGRVPTTNEIEALF